jgi:maltooligosyltrehalose trehalohydrolase
MSTTNWQQHHGANPHSDGGTGFRVWAPKSQTVAVHLVSGDAAGTIPLSEEEHGYFSAAVPGAADGDRYFYQLDDGVLYPDPVSRSQPDGVHGASQIVDPRLFDWQDGAWGGIALERYVIYELHVGTFSCQGTFEGVIPHLDYLVELGISAVELMPVAQFPGSRNWGYDGVNLFAPQNSYGGPGELKRLVDACHRKGLAVILDVVYNHFGPEGNHLGAFGGYFTDKYHTPWGAAMNFDGPDSDQVRDFFIGNALYWIREFHLDALRLDAVDWILDQSARHFLRELACAVHEAQAILGRQLQLFAENDTNDVRLIEPHEAGGYALDAQWDDNFHHALRALLTGETSGYYEDFGQFSQLVKAYSEGFVYTGEYSSFRRRRHGAPSGDRPTSQFVAFSQNHDQIGNRKGGDRLCATQPLEKLLLAAGAVLLSPYLPLLFMGEEYGEQAPFHYFVSHSDLDLIEAVRRGKLLEHACGVCEGGIPDPAAEATFLESKLDLDLVREGEQAVILQFYRRLLALRRELPTLQVFQRDRIEVKGLAQQKILTVLRRAGSGASLCIFSFSNLQQIVELDFGAGDWVKVLDSSEQQWKGAGQVAPADLAVARDDESHLIPVNPFSLLVYVCAASPESAHSSSPRPIPLSAKALAQADARGEGEL